MGKAAAAFLAAVLLIAGGVWAYSSLKKPAPSAPAAQRSDSPPVQEALETFIVVLARPRFLSCTVCGIFDVR